MESASPSSDPTTSSGNADQADGFTIRHEEYQEGYDDDGEYSREPGNNDDLNAILFDGVLAEGNEAVEDLADNDGQPTEEAAENESGENESAGENSVKPDWSAIDKALALAANPPIYYKPPYPEQAIRESVPFL